MKNLILLLLLPFSILAQVNTSPQNKKVLLEEFTGIHCGYCPDGHLLAQNLHDAYPDDVFLINIHTGGYASPGQGEPDFRTNWGSGIVSQTDIAGYPAGTINRYFYQFMTQGGGTAMSRGDWQDAATDQMSMLSPVNIWAQANYNSLTNEIDIDVEYYYTAAQAFPLYENYLNVAIVQNDIPGPQSGANQFNPDQIIPGPWSPTYNHQHMLRDLVTGQWGEPIQALDTGVVNNISFSWQVPADINDIFVDVYALDVVVFMTESYQNVFTATQVPVEFGSNTFVKEITSVLDNNTTYDIFGREVERVNKNTIYIKNNKKFIKF
jgi:thiol-disulfide isomerase/thioredoxin|tara:strand:- start:3 stop:968 length:966 start_codon:yes stop_codon:yes gene_type:complete